MTHITRTSGSLALALILGAFIAGSMATTMSLHDWQLNPDDLFHTGTGTNWRVVGETWISWFGPVFLAVTAPGLLVAYARSLWGWMQADPEAPTDPLGVLPPVPPAPSLAPPSAPGRPPSTDAEAPPERGRPT